MSLLEHTIFINLESRLDRRIHAQKQLVSVGIHNPIRFPGVKTSHGAVGCSLSHLKCLEMAKTNGWETVFICEDDITFKSPEVFLNSIAKFQSRSMRDGIQWDVLLVAGNNCPPHVIPDGVDYCVKISNCQTTLGYIVRRSYYDVLISNIREGVAHLIKNPTNKTMFAIDMFWKQLQHKDNWYLLVPLTITQLSGYSDVEEKEINYDHLMLDLDKPWLLSYFSQQQTMNNMTCFRRKLY